MGDYYADSSVLVKRHVQELGSAWFQALAAPAAHNLIFTASISIVEFYSALNRRRREATLDLAYYQAIAADFDALCVAQYTLIELTNQVIERSRELIEHHPLRSYDAIQLATALVTNRTLLLADLPALTFLSADQRLLSAAQAEGLAVDNPAAHP